MLLLHAFTLLSSCVICQSDAYYLTFQWLVLLQGQFIFPQTLDLLLGILSGKVGTGFCDGPKVIFEFTLFNNVHSIQYKSFLLILNHFLAFLFSHFSFSSRQPGNLQFGSAFDSLEDLYLLYLTLSVSSYIALRWEQRSRYSGMPKNLKESCRISYSISSCRGKMQKYSSLVLSLQMRLILFQSMALYISLLASLKVKLSNSSSTNSPPGCFSTRCINDLQSVMPSYLLLRLILKQDFSVSLSVSIMNWYLSLYLSMSWMAVLNLVMSLGMLKVSRRSSITFFTELLLRICFQSYGLPQLRLNYSSIYALRMEMVLLSRSRLDTKTAIVRQEQYIISKGSDQLKID